ncbi:serine/threonine-protein kinase [Agrococcus terreus]|uniref:non-specific serine/threonine protein kinase n=1 Tax=Agrococcus terreus TaxID=574649 RepID=A0ABQ2KPR7_9MICO|nr:serine/threonine-protein kinase [Agrococcus terreus]GGN88675.1 hypothetical protein GCM10010968_24520 [Agrococcus terreus]
MDASDPFAPGTSIDGRYTVEGKLGSGGMSTVLRAHDEHLDLPVAVKVLLGAPTDPVTARRAQHEVQVLSSLQHESLVTLLDAGQLDVLGRSVGYLVMDLVDGPTLAGLLESGPMDAGDVAQVGRAIAGALAEVHAHGVVHRDVKPGNILLAASNVPDRAFDAKLADFGIASFIDSTRITMTGTVLGSAAYVSPEQASGERVGPPTDVYALGLILLEALQGAPVYQGALMEMLTARMLRDPAVPESLGPAWSALLTAMTARDAAARPSAADVADALAHVPGDVHVDRRAGSRLGPVAIATDVEPLERRRRRRRAAIIGGVAVAAAVVGLGAVVALQPTTAEPASEQPVAVTQPPADESPAVVADDVVGVAVDDEADAGADAVDAASAGTAAVVPAAGSADAADVEPVSAGSAAPAATVEPDADADADGSSNGNGNGNGRGNSTGNGNGSGNGNPTGNGSSNGNGNGRDANSGSGPGQNSGNGRGPSAER